MKKKCGVFGEVCARACVCVCGGSIGKGCDNKQTLRSNS